MKKLLFLLPLLFVVGCFSSPPVYKKAPRQPLPKESFESQERTRQAIQLILDYCKEHDIKGEIEELIRSLLVKLGAPVEKVPQKEAKDLAEDLKEDAKKQREERKEWEETYDSSQYYIQRSETIIEKGKRYTRNIIIITIICLIFFPTATLGVLRFIKRKIQVAKEKVDEALKKEAEFDKRRAKQTEAGIEEFKKDNPEMWAELEIYLKEKHDQDVQKKIKEENRSVR